MKDIERAYRLAQRDDLVPHATGNAVQIARSQCLLLIANEEDRLSFEDHADLFMRMCMFFDDRVGLEIHDGHHHPFRGRGANVDARKNRVPATLLGAWKK